MKIGSDRQTNISTIKHFAVILLAFLCSEAVLLLVFLSSMHVKAVIAISIAVFIAQIIGGVLVLKKITSQNRNSIEINTVLSLAHDLKSPLASVKGFTQAIKDGTIPDKDKGKYFEIIIGEIDRMDSYIASVSEIAKLSDGKYVVNKTEFDINKIIIQALVSLEKRIEEKGITIKGIDNKKVLVYADIDFVSRAMNNLIDNAVKYVDEKGYISFELNNTDMNIIIYIENSGKGMTKSECESAFDRFYRTDSARSSSVKGLGLGLNITKQMIEQSGGKISVTSVPSEYVRFAVELPKLQKKENEIIHG